jgi:hypothetical protein
MIHVHLGVTIFDFLPFSVFDFQFGTVPIPYTYYSRLFESNSPGMEEDTQKKKSKIEGVNRVGDEHKKF